MYDMANIKKLRLLGEGAPSAWEGFKAFDKAATPNVSAQSAALSVATLPDTQAPTLPSGLTASSIATGSITLGWAASTDLPNPGSGLDAVRVQNGHWALIYNDTTKGRNSLAVSLSDDEGKSWKWTRHLERHEAGSYHYPAIIQGRDGTLHAVYSYFVPGGKSMKHAAFNEAWIRRGDEK